MMLNELLEAWRYTRDGVIAEFANLPPDCITDRPAGLGRSAVEIVEHIVASGRLMAGELSRVDGDFCRASYDALIAEHSRATDRVSSPAEALELLRASFDQDSGRLRGAGLHLMQQPIRQFNGEYASRLAWMHHGIAHEEYHRGQLALYARLCGVTPALTKLIRGE